LNFSGSNKIAAKFNINAGEYFLYVKHDIPKATAFFETAVSLSTVCEDPIHKSHAFGHTSLIKWMTGDYSLAQLHAQEAQRCAQLSANLYEEANALRMEAIVCRALGDYKASIRLIRRARELLELSGLTGGENDRNLMFSEAELHLLKTEYIEARKIHTHLLLESSLEQDPSHHGFALLNISEIDIAIGANSEVIEENLNKAKAIFHNMQFSLGLMICDITLADLRLRDGLYTDAKLQFRKHLHLSWGKSSDAVKYILNKLGNTSSWSTTENWPSTWTMVFLVYTLKLKDRLAIHNALQYVGDVFLARRDEDTAISLFTAALEGFTAMDIHRSRADCMVRLGNISYQRGNPTKAVEFWNTARPLFERSSQVKDAASIDTKVAMARELVNKRSTAAPLAAM
jgi:tetratricopeptide (TPR) repeat protein